MTAGKLYVVTYDGSVIVNQNNHTYSLMPCTTEEADGRMFAHASDATQAFSKLLIKTVDSNVVVIEISAFHRVARLLKL